MAKIGYARVSTRGQNDDSQIDELKAAGCDRIFTDQGVTGEFASCPQLDAALAYMRDGDTFVITRLSRAMRSLQHLLELTDELQRRHIDLVVLKALERCRPVAVAKNAGQGHGLRWYGMVFRACNLKIVSRISPETRWAGMRCRRGRAGGWGIRGCPWRR
jgi:Resolvase, N terminal domain